VNRRTPPDWSGRFAHIGEALAEDLPSPFDVCVECGGVVFHEAMDTHMWFFHSEPEPDPKFWRTIWSRIRATK
jgi:hypothetical protein